MFLVLHRLIVMKIIPDKIKGALVACLIALVLPNGRAQGEMLNIDSLALVFMNREKVDLKTFDLLFVEVHLMYPEELAHFAEILLKRSIQQEVPEGIYRAHDAFAFYFLSKGYFNHAFRLLLKAKNYYESEDLLLYRMKNYYYIARVYVAMGNLSDAINWMYKSIDLAEKNPDRNSLYTLRNDLATIYFRAGNYENGKAQLDLNEKEWAQLSLPHQVDLRTLQGNYLMNLQKSSEAKAKYVVARELALKTESPILIATSYTNLGIYEFDYDIQKSKEHFESSLFYAHMSNYPDKIALDYFNLAFWHYATESLDSALYYFETSYLVVEKVNAFTPMLDALEEMIGIHRQNENWQKVDELQGKIQEIKTKQYQQLMQSYNDLSLFDELESSTAKENSARQQDGYLFGLQENSKTFWVVILLIAFVCIQSTVIFFLYKRQKLLNKPRVTK